MTPKTTPKSLFVNISHSGIRSRDKEVLRHAYFVNIYSILAALSVGAFGLMHVLQDHSLLGRTELIAAAIFIANIAVLRFTKNTQLAAVNFLLTVITMLVVMLATGGTANTGIFWFFVFPPAALFLAGKRAGVLWITVLYAVTTACLVLAELQVIQLAYSTEIIRQMLIILFVVSLGIYAYQQRSEMAEEATRNTRRALQEEQSKAEAVLQNIGDAIVASNTEGKVILMNHAAEEMFGWTFAELEGKAFAEFVPMIAPNGKPVPRAERPLKPILASDETQQLSLTYQRKNGRIFPVTAIVTPIRAGNKTTGLIAAIRDISRERQIDRAKSEFVTLASHQLRTPISGISWFTEMLLHGDAGKMTEEQHDYIEQIYASTQRLAAIVDAMLMVSSLELGTLATQNEAVDLAELSGRIVQEQLHGLPIQKTLHVTEQYDPKLRPIATDPTAMRTILRNLISNATKYTPTDGTILVTIKPVAHGQSQPKLVIRVSDSGYGIPLEEQKNVFVKMFRAENARQHDPDGTGLGLYITKGLVQHMGGEISFESSEDTGSIFTVTLPYSKTKRGHV